MTEAQITNILGGPEQQQRRGLRRSDQEIGGLARKLKRFHGSLPPDFLQTEAGSKLAEALQGARNFLTDSRRAIRGEITPLDQG